MNRTFVNITCSILALAVNVAINLILSPIIVETIGVEANGFVTLANNCVTYAQLFATALNGMAARFITVERARENFEKANLYYNSVFWGNLVLVATLLVPATCCIVRLEYLFDVPGEILWDVKLLFLLVFLNFFASTGLPKWECGLFAANRLDRSYVAQAAGMIARCITVFLMFAVLSPRVWYVGFAATLMTAIVLFANACNAHILAPYLRIGIRKENREFSFAALKDLFFSGIWNSIQSAGSILSSGFDILISNVMLGATAMGTISLSKMLPSLMQQLSASICNALAPELTIDWAKGDRDRLMGNIERTMKITSCIMTVPLVGIMVFGDRFYGLWVPSQDAKLLWGLSVLGVFGYAFTSGVQILYNVFTALNKVRSNAIAVLVSGAASVIVTILLVQTTPFGIFAIAGVSSVMNLIRNLAFMLPITAHYLGCRWFQFYPQVLRSNASVAALLVIGFAIKLVIPDGTWAHFLVAIALYAFLGAAFNVMFLLSRDERMLIKQKLHCYLEQIRS